MTSECNDSKCSDHVTLSPKSGWIVRPTKIVTLQPQKVGRSVTVKHYHPLVFLVSIVCGSASPLSPSFPLFSSWMLGPGRFLIILHCWKFLCVTLIEFFAIFWALYMVSHTKEKSINPWISMSCALNEPIPRYSKSHPTEVYQPKDQCAVCPYLT